VRFKRYLLPEIERRTEAYVQLADVSYSEAVKDQNREVPYNDPVAGEGSSESEEQKEAVRYLAPSTVYRWISTTDSWQEAVQPIVKRARQSEPAERVVEVRISPRKYRSAARRRVLKGCGKLLRALRFVFRPRNPTELATLGRSP
jgi:hypothetical protein